MSTILTFLTAVINFGLAVLNIKKQTTLSEKSIVVIAIVLLFALTLLALCFLFRKN